MKLDLKFLLISLLALSPGLRASGSGNWVLDAAAGELQPLNFSGPPTAPEYILNEAEISHQKEGGPTWSLEYETYIQNLVSDFYLFRLERDSWFRPQTTLGQSPLNSNLGWSAGWEWGVAPGLVSSGPELGVQAQIRVWRKLWWEAKAEQTFYSDAMDSQAFVGFSLRGLLMKGLKIRAGVPIMSVWQQHIEPAWTSQIGLGEVGLTYYWGGQP